MPSESLTHLKAVFLVRCTKKNIDTLSTILQKSPKFSQINLCKYTFSTDDAVFTNRVDTN